MAELEGEEDKAKKAKKEWDQLDEKVKSEMDSQYKLELEKYKQEF